MKDKASILKYPMLIRLAIATTAFYLMTRAVLISFGQYSTVDRVLGILFFLAEGFIMLHGINYFIGLYRLSKVNEAPPAEQNTLTTFPEVAILIPARHEPKEILENTVSSANDMSYPNKTIYILDDSSIEQYKNEAQEIADQYGCVLFRRKERHGAKAGVINDCIRQLKEKYIAVFDVDQSPLDGFLTRTVSTLEADPKLAFIQTPQYYSHLTRSKISHAANMQQAIFYEYVCEFKNIIRSVICCGTNVVFRIQALREVGGFDETSVTEDFATSLKLHSHGWQSIYDKRVSAIGQGPLNLGAYLAQQNRWAQGNTQVFKKIIKKFVTHPGSLTPLQWLEYFSSGTYYFVGWAYIFLMLLPLLYIFFSIPTFLINPYVYALTYIPYFIFSHYAFFGGMLRLNYTYPQIWQGQLLLFISIPTYLIATFLGFIGVKSSFKVTSKEDISYVPYTQLWPQIVLAMIHLSALVWGLNRLVYERNMAVFFNCVWIVFHLVLVSSVFYFNEEEETEVVAPAA